MIKAVIFDMDGVLIDAKEWHYEALNKALLKFGYEISRHDHLVTFDGLPTRTKLEMLSQQDGLPGKLHGFINSLKQKYTMQIVNEKCVPNFVHRFALSKLRAEGYKMAVASNSIRNSIASMMEFADLQEYLEFYMSNEDVVNGKPDPEIYIKTIDKLGFLPEECLIVEDNFNGIKAARASGAHVLEVQTVDDVNYLNIRNKIKQIEGEAEV
ncbi:HAD family hydrolase [Rhodanobacter aciditrophus]|uniref:HAD family hydrolase n=1 Tax=Rhodanobacter aciditrophus TaxID=1623218 RepID=A0ABW4AZZ2_9GAMM